MNRRKLAFVFWFPSKCSNTFSFSAKPSIFTGYTIYSTKPYVLIWFQFLHLFHHFRRRLYSLIIWKHTLRTCIRMYRILNMLSFGYVALGRSSRFQSILFYCGFVCSLDDVIKSMWYRFRTEFYWNWKFARILCAVWAVSIRKSAHGRQALKHISSEIMMSSSSVFPCANNMD